MDQMLEASEEYLDWVNTDYNDVFAFLISGPGITGPYTAPANFPNGAMNLELGMPNLYHKSTSIIIPDYAMMNYEIISSEFIDYENINIAPSKGNISRLVNPDNVEYSFNDIYESDLFYPSSPVKMNDPYVLRDLRGQAIEFTHFQYYANSKTLRVYTNLVVRFFDNGVDQRNIMPNRVNNSIPKEYQNILSEETFKIPKFGTINLHASPLPYYRGGSPLNWMIINGEKKIGISIIQVDTGIDTGPILAQKFFKLSPKATSDPTELDIFKISSLFVLINLFLLQKLRLFSLNGYSIARLIFYMNKLPLDSTVSGENLCHFRN